MKSRILLLPTSSAPCRHVGHSFTAVAGIQDARQQLQNGVSLHGTLHIALHHPLSSLASTQHQVVVGTREAAASFGCHVLNPGQVCVARTDASVFNPE